MTRRRKRETSTFSLSFLDIMSCGLGAAVLIFLLLKHVVDSPVPNQKPTDSSEISLLEEEILYGEKNLVRIRNTISDISDETVTAEGAARKIQEEIDSLKSEVVEITSDSDADIPSLKAKLARLKAQKQILETTVPTGNKAYEFSGDGRRQYLTGVPLDGRNVLVLLDTSASMLDEKIINIIRRRHLQDDAKRQAPKWGRALNITQWIIANLPLDSEFQLLSFDEEVKPLIGDKSNQWHQVSNKLDVAKAVENSRKVVPANGTNLQKVFDTAMAMNPRPDQIFLITDGLPTLGDNSPKSGSISGRERLKLFRKAVKSIERGISVNTFLLPLEGDTYAAGSFWQLAIRTGGSYITPARDWP